MEIEYQAKIKNIELPSEDKLVKLEMENGDKHTCKLLVSWKRFLKKNFYNSILTLLTGIMSLHFIFWYALPYAFFIFHAYVPSVASVFIS